VWRHPGRLTPLLEPERYFDDAAYAREVATMFASGWHYVTTTHALAHPGDFITLELFGEPVLLRNCDGQLRAFQNVCAHRHALLTSEPCGSSKRLRCQYHGWEYDADGRTCGVPDAASFVPIRKRGEGLQRLRVATCGQLVFASIAEDGLSLREELGESTWTLLEQRFSSQFELVGRWHIEHAANWKIVVENSLEGYHLPFVHPSTLAKLADPRDFTHTLEPAFTKLENTVPPGGRGMRIVTRFWRDAPDGLYVHLHAFPSLMVPATDTWSMMQYVQPLSATTSRSVVALFGHRGDGHRWFQRLGGVVLWRVLERYIRQVQAEDNAMFGNVQRGLRSSEQTGVIGAREERIHAFQQYVANRC
jgi:choline monooxygenase